MKSTKSFASLICTKSNDFKLQTKQESIKSNAVFEVKTAIDIDPVEVTWKRIESGQYFSKFDKLARVLKEQEVLTRTKQGSDTDQKTDYSTSIPSAIQKPFTLRTSVEHNLLFGVVFKMLEQVDKAACKIFAVVADLMEKLTVSHYSKGDVIVAERESLT